MQAEEQEKIIIQKAALREIAKFVLAEKFKSSEIKEKIEAEIIFKLTKHKKFQDSQVILYYKSLKDELDLNVLKENNPEKTWLVPIITKNKSLVFIEDNEDNAELIKLANRLKLSEEEELFKDALLDKASDYMINELELILVPSLAFFKDKTRLGRGGGYYDRFFEKVYKIRDKTKSEEPYILGLGVKEMAIEKYPREEFDQSVDEVIWF
ncbi:MAG: 5-formyltetrahydrofolate cyclo-ligase [Candidatus Caenarcaniphilales bacterium]|nr:5-formyltetrahydrofolate cyclo-ligase [Candidatus Caenarcaniphilales bacterium]